MIFFGSQTGTAEEFAGRLMKDARRFSFKPMIADLKVSGDMESSPLRVRALRRVSPLFV